MSDAVRTFRHHREVPITHWRWPNFSPAEIACRGTGALKLDPIAMDRLQGLRDRLGKPLIIRSAYRSPAHNRAVGGAPRSKHMDGTAFDIAMANHGLDGPVPDHERHRAGKRSIAGGLTLRHGWNRFAAVVNSPEACRHPAPATQPPSREKRNFARAMCSEY